MANVTLTNLVKSYASSPRAEPVMAVKGIDLEIRDREFMVLVGPSGCGKSTTLRMIAGLEEITGGTIAIDGRVVNDVPPKDRDIAMVFQNYALYPHMSVYDNMAFGLKLRNLAKSEIDARVREAAAMLQIEHLLERKPKALSGGQRQRVAVGRAIVRKPKVFLFDEPLSNLDAKMRVSTRTEISKLHARLGATMIYVTHDQVEAMTMGDRICVMKDGRIMQLATPLELYNNPANMFVAGFIGSPPMNFIRGDVVRTADRLHFVEAGNPAGGLKFPLSGSLARSGESRSGQPVVLGVRPENIRLVNATDAEIAHGTTTVDLVEPMGAETYLHLTTGHTALVARVSASGRHEAGDKAAIVFEQERARLFDPETEAALI